MRTCLNIFISIHVCDKSGIEQKYMLAALYPCISLIHIVPKDMGKYSTLAMSLFLFAQREFQLKFFFSATKLFNFNSVAILLPFAEIFHTENKQTQTKANKNFHILNFYWIVSSKYHDFQVMPSLVFILFISSLFLFFSNC